MGYNKIYHLFVFGAAFPHIVASVLTWYALEFTMRKECNPIMAASFGVNGYLIPTIIGTLLLVSAMYATPIFMRQTEQPGLWSVTILSLMVVGMSIDALNDIFVISGSPLADFTNAFFRLLYQALSTPMAC